jgi:hypothetical protein
LQPAGAIEQARPAREAGRLRRFIAEECAMDRNRGPTGPVTTFGEADYRFGAGPLTMRVESVDWTRPLQHDGEDWYEVDGIELTSDGREVGRRQALVRGSRLSSSPRNRRA